MSDLHVTASHYRDCSAWVDQFEHHKRFFRTETGTIGCIFSVKMNFLRQGMKSSACSEDQVTEEYDRCMDILRRICILDRFRTVVVTSEAPELAASKIIIYEMEEFDPLCHWSTVMKHQLLRPDRFMWLCRSICDLIDFYCDEHILHHDLALRNLVIDTKGTRVRLIDFDAMYYIPDKLADRPTRDRLVSQLSQPLLLDLCRFCGLKLVDTAWSPAWLEYCSVHVETYKEAIQIVERRLNPCGFC